MDVFINGDLEQGFQKPSKNKLFTLENDVVKPNQDNSRKDIHYYNPILLAQVQAKRSLKALAMVTGEAELIPEKGKDGKPIP